MASVMDTVKDSWPVLAGFAAGLVAWGKSAATISEHGRRLDDHERGMSGVKSDITAIREAVAKTEAHSDRTRESVEAIFRELKDLREKR